MRSAIPLLPLVASSDSLLSPVLKHSHGCRGRGGRLPCSSPSLVLLAVELDLVQFVL